MCHLGQTLSYKQRIHNTKMKVTIRNNLLKKLSNSKWGCNASTIRTTALALSYSAAEYACPVWIRSLHASKLDPDLNDACRSITGCLRPTNVEKLYILTGIAPPDIRRNVCARVERRNRKQTQPTLYTVRFQQRRRLKREWFLIAPYDLLTSLQKSCAAVNGNTGRTWHHTTALSTWMNV